MRDRVTETAELRVVADGIPFEIVRASYVRQRFAPHAHETYAIGVIEFGASRVAYRGEWERHVPGGVIVIAPGEVHNGEADHPAGWSYRMIYPPEAMVAHAVGEFTPAPVFARSFYEDAALAHDFGEVHRALEGADSLVTGSLMLHGFLRELVRRHACTVSPSRTRSESAVVAGVRQYLHTHYSRPVALDELSHLAGLSTFHLIRVFKRAVGLPPHSYLGQVRVQRARELLRSGESISGTAFATGFSDQSHLTRHFRRVVGVTPGEYVRAYHGRAPRAYSTRRRPLSASR
jgi:AraC-like DNA-binding protein